MKRLVLLLLVWLLGPSTGLAHRLSVDWRVADGWLIITANTEGTAAAGADVTVAAEDGSVVQTGVLDESGRFSAAIPADAGVTVTVNAGLGHRRSLTLSAEQLRAGRTLGGDLATAGTVASNRPPADPSASGTSETVFSLPARVGTGLALLFALAALWMSYRNSRRLTALERQMEGHARRG